MIKTAAAIVLVGVAVGFSGVLDTLGGGGHGAAPAVTSTANATAVDPAANDSEQAQPAAQSGPTPEICSRLLIQYANGQIGAPEDRNPSTAVAAANHARQTAYQQRLEGAGCTAAYMDANGEAILELVNRGRSGSEIVR